MRQYFVFDDLEPGLLILADKSGKYFSVLVISVVSTVTSVTAKILITENGITTFHESFASNPSSFFCKGYKV